MNPWIAHLENRDLQWIIDNSQGAYFDLGVSISFRRPTLILDGELECRGHLRGGGALLGLSEWYLDVETAPEWIVTMPVWALDLPVTTKHEMRWATAFAVAMSAEMRLLQPEGRGIADVEAARLKFRYVLSRLEHFF